MMLNNLIQLLRLDDFYGCHEVIDIAKGSKKYTTKFKEVYKQAIRKQRKKSK